MNRPCLGFNGSCPNAGLTQKTRCRDCERRFQAARNRRPERGIYGGKWRAVSKAAREEQPFCSLCYAIDDLTLDHTSGMVVCRSCHRSEKQGGVLAKSQGYAR